MAEIFTWAPLVDPTGDISFRTRSAQFGDGYKQVAADGINNEQQSWPLTFGGEEEEISQIVAFLRAHKGSTAFLWTPPLGVQSLWICPSFSATPHTPGLYSISATFELFYS